MMVQDIAMNLNAVYMKNSRNVDIEAIASLLSVIYSDVFYPYQQAFSETLLSVKTDYNRLLR